MHLFFFFFLETKFVEKEAANVIQNMLDSHWMDPTKTKNDYLF